MEAEGLSLRAMHAHLRFHYQDAFDIESWEDEKLLKRWFEFKFVKIQRGEWKTGENKPSK